MNGKCLLIAVAVLAVSVPAWSSGASSRNKTNLATTPLVRTNKLLQGLMSSVKNDFSKLINRVVSNKKTVSGKSGRRFHRNGNSSEFTAFNFDLTDKRKTASFINFRVSSSTGSKDECPNVQIELESSGKNNAKKRVKCLTKCPKGFQLRETSAKWCVPCSAGSWKSSSGNQRCAACVPGTFSALSKATACSKCPVGSFINKAGASDCSKCPAGSFTNVIGTTACSKCPVGSFTNKAGASDCSKCPAGSFTNEAGATACIKCPAGSFTNKAGASDCSKCPAGSSSGPGATSCFKCKAGFSSSNGAPVCAPCPAGSFTNQEGKSACSKCPAGSSSGPGATSCIKCKVGTFLTTGEAPTCKPCPAGSFINQTGEKSCTPCPPGTYSSNTGASNCDECDLNFAMARKSGMDKCDLCPNSGATHRSRTKCYAKAIPSCDLATNGIPFGETPKKMCLNTIDNNLKTFGVSASREFLIRHRLHQFPTFFRYEFPRQVHVRRIGIWHKPDAPKVALDDLKLVYEPSKTNCIVSRNNSVETDSYVMIENCYANNVKEVQVTYWKKSRAIEISEIAFYVD